MSTTSYRHLSGSPAAHYERYFVPTVATAVSHDLLRAAGLGHGDRVLDVACGTGLVARRAADLVGPSGSVAAVDLEPGMIEVAEATAQGAAIEWHVADALALPLADRSRDVVLCQMGLMLMADPPAAVREMRRVLRPEGRLVISTPGPIQPPFEAMARAVAEHLDPRLEGFVRAVFSMPDPEQVAQLLREAGLDGIEVETSPTALRLPPPADFLWQYVHLTPMGPLVEGAPETAKDAFERQVVEAWQPFVVDGETRFDQPMVIASAHR